MPAQPEARLEIVNQMLNGEVKGDSVVHFRVSPKQPGKFSYTIHSNIAALDGKTGSYTSYLTPPGKQYHPAPDLPHWWTDDPSEELKEGEHIGAKTVNQWRVEFLSDFAKRMDRCNPPESN